MLINHRPLLEYRLVKQKILLVPFTVLNIINQSKRNSRLFKSSQS